MEETTAYYLEKVNEVLNVVFATKLCNCIFRVLCMYLLIHLWCTLFYKNILSFTEMFEFEPRTVLTVFLNFSYFEHLYLCRLYLYNRNCVTDNPRELLSLIIAYYCLLDWISEVPICFFLNETKLSKISNSFWVFGLAIFLNFGNFDPWYCYQL